MSSRPDRILLEDMHDACGRIARYVAGYTGERFLADEKTTDAVVRNLEIMGEAANRVSPALRERHPVIEWRKIIGLRHRIVHDYFGVDLEVVWEICTRDVPVFAEQIEVILNGPNGE